MAYELRELSGSIWANDRKAQPEQPDYKGTVLVGGVTYYLSGWKKDHNGREWLSLAFTAKDAVQGQAVAERAPAASVATPRGTSKGAKAIMDMEDDIPF